MCSRTSIQRRPTLASPSHSSAKVGIAAWKRSTPEAHVHWNFLRLKDSPIRTRTVLILASDARAMTSSDPLKIERLSALFLSFAFGVIGFSVGLNSLIKFNQERSYVEKAAPQGSVVYIDIHDVFSTGGVITAVCAIIAVLSTIFFAFTWCPVKDKRFWFRIQSCSLFFCSIWLFASLIPFEYYFANRSAQISATLDGFPVPQTVIQEIAQALGVTSVYQDVYYVRLLAVLPWFALLFAVTAGVVLHLAVGRTGPPSFSETEQDEKLHRSETRTETQA